MERQQVQAVDHRAQRRHQAQPPAPSTQPLPSAKQPAKPPGKHMARIKSTKRTRSTSLPKAKRQKKRSETVGSHIATGRPADIDSLTLPFEMLGEEAPDTAALGFLDEVSDIVRRNLLSVYHGCVCMLVRTCLNSEIMRIHVRAACR